MMVRAKTRADGQFITSETAFLDVHYTDKEKAETLSEIMCLIHR